MAIIKSLAIGKAKGSMGNITYAYLGGDTIGKGKIAFPKIPRTYNQMHRRTAWANLVNLWQTLTMGWHPSFEQAFGRVSDYNLFLSRNINQNRVYLTKGIASAGGSVAAAYVITEGSLPAVQNEITNGVLKSDITVDNLVLNEETTVADFSTAVVDSNLNFEYGDQISFIYCRQTLNSVTGIPYVVTVAEEITLDGTDTETLLIDVVSPEYFSIVDNKIGTSTQIEGAAAYVHSRKQGDETLVSTQSLVAANGLLTTFQSDTAKNLAIESYGGKLSTPFLTPNITDIVAPE